MHASHTLKVLLLQCLKRSKCFPNPGMGEGARTVYRYIALPVHAAHSKCTVGVCQVVNLALCPPLLLFWLLSYLNKLQLVLLHSMFFSPGDSHKPDLLYVLQRDKKPCRHRENVQTLILKNN